MSDTGASAFGWVCPTCNRQVPGKIERCRCGFERVDAKATTTAPDAATSASPRGTRAVVEAAVLCLVIAAGVYYYASVQIAPAAQHPSLTTAGTPSLRLRSIVPRSDNAVVTHRAPERTAASDPAVTRATSGDLPEPTAVPLEDLIEHAMPAVVLVEAAKTRGSGFLARPDLAVTNAHVIAGASSVTVTMKDGTKLAGTVVASSSELDLALVSIARSGSSDVALPLGESSTLRLGQGIVALGWAEDLTQSTVTRGIVTGLRHDGKQRLVQTDAVPNHGDSGGPVLDRLGAVVGVTTFRAEVRGATAGFAVAVDDLKAFIADSGR
jgi:S1-C subfamily serine protease